MIVRATGEHKVPVWLHNETAGSREALARTYRTNPGAAALYVHLIMRHPLRGGEPVRHPGQVIRALKEGIYGLDSLPSAAWKSVAGADPELVRKLAGDLRARTTGLGVLAWLLTTVREDTWARPSAGARRLMTRVATFSNSQDEEFRERDRRFIESFLRECRLSRRVKGRKMSEVLDEAGYIFDWLAEETGPVRARTWRGYPKAARRWHGREAERTLEERREAVLTRRDGRYDAWNSLVGEFEKGELRVVPLADEMELVRESLQMKHCVDTRARACAVGGVRLFRVELDGNPQATGEINLVRLGNGNEGWERTEVRGYRNRAASQEALDALSEAAQRYNREWQGGGRHRSWREVLERERE